ncbi:MAG TPA: caspase family protein [Gemmataceae bacterium]|nr:caspase family protein [Gemmataceae bacterium]
MTTQSERKYRGGMGWGVLLAFVAWLSPADAGQERTVPPQEAVLELLVPAGTKVSIDGEDQGTRRSFRYEGFERGQLYPYEVAVQFPNGGKARRTVLLRGGWDVRLPLTETGASKFGLVVQTGHTSVVASVAFSPDGKYVLTGSHDNTAILWDARNGQKLRTFQGHRHVVRSVAFSPDGKQTLTGSDDHTAILWDARSGQKLRTFQGHTHPVESVAFSPDGKHVLTGSSDNTAILWEARTGERLRTFQGHTLPVSSVAFSADLKHVLTGSWDHTAIFWDARTGEKLRAFQGTDWVLSVAFSPDGKHVLTGSGDNTAILWNARTGQKLRTFQGHTASVSSVAFSADGKHAITGSDDKTAIQWDARTGRKLRTFQGYTNNVQSLAFSADGKHVVTGSGDNTAILWDARNGQKFRTLAHNSRVRAVAFSPDGKHVLTGSEDNTAILWDAQTGDKLRILKHTTNLRFFEAAVSSVAFSPDGKHVLTGSRLDTAIILWDAQTGDKLRTFQGHTDWVLSVGFSPDGKHVLTGSGDNTAILWDARNGQKFRTLAHNSRVRAVAFSPDGKHVLTVSSDGTRLWDVATGDELARLINLDAGRDWLVVTPEGLFDGSAGGRQLVSYRIGTGLNVVPVDRFFQDFYRPGLLADLFKGQRPMPEVELAKNRPPTLRILSPKDGGIAEDNEVTLEAEAVDEGGGVQGPWLFHNGARLLDRSEPQTIGKRVLRRFRVALVEGDNRLEVKAASGDGSWESEPAVITLRYAKPLAKPELYLLAIGIDRYAEDTLRLKFARADAQALADLFRRRGKTLYRDVHPVTLLDDRATKAAIIKTLQDIARKAKRQDTLLVFVAGHGTMIGQRYYFIPHEFRRGDAALEDAIRKQGLAADVLGDYLATVPVLKRMLILDTCASGGAVGLTTIKRNPFAFRGAIERLSRSQGVFTLAAAASGEEAGEVQELGHGVLSYALLAGLNAVAAGPLKERSIHPGNAERVASVLEWFNFASGQVPRLTKRYFGREQDVQMSSQGNSFPVLPVEDK